MTVAVSCVQSAISLEEETPAFFFSVWSKHILTASHSILKHLQLGADEDIKKTHPKHLCQPAVKTLLLSPASPYRRGSSSSLFWLYNRSAQDYAHSTQTRPWHGELKLSFSSHLQRFLSVPVPLLCKYLQGYANRHRAHTAPILNTNIHRMTRACYAANKMPNKTIHKAMEIQTRRGKGGLAERRSCYCRKGWAAA